MSTQKFPVSVSLVLVALSSLADATHASIPVQAVSSDTDEGCISRVKQTMASRPVTEFIGRNAADLANGLTLDGQTLRLDPNVEVVAQSDDSTKGAISCYANCYSNCYGACHSSRGWR